jgi:replicative DNA helicase
MFRDPDYFAKVFTNLRDTDFPKIEDKIIFGAFDQIHQKHKKIATVEEMKMFLSSSGGFRNEVKKLIDDRLTKIEEHPIVTVNKDILLETTQAYVRNVRLDQLIERGITMREGKNTKDTPEILMEYMKKDIVEMSFQASLGHDYWRDAAKRFEEYGKLDDNLVSSGIELMDVAGAGLPKRLVCLLSVSNGGKSLHMASWAANASIAGKKVAIFSMEDGEIGYGSRLDANLMNTTLEHMKQSGIAMMTEFSNVIDSSYGGIKIKEFPTGTANANHLRATLMDWKVKDNFVPDIIFADYINIMTSCRKQASNGYENGKLVAEELRAIAVEFNVPVVTATQGKREVFASANLSMADVAESIGIPQTADVMIGIVGGGEEQPDKQFISVLKSRQINKSKLKPCAINVSTEHQRVWDIDDRRKSRVSNEVKQTFVGMETFVATSEILETKSETITMPTTVPVGRNADLADLFKGL